MRFPALALAPLLLLAPAAPAATVDEDLAPGRTVLSTVLPADEVETYRVEAPAGSVLKVDLRPLGKKSAFLPSLEATLPDGSTAVLPAPKKGRTKAILPFARDGVVTLRIASSDGSAGDYRMTTKLKPGKCPILSGEVLAGDPTPLPFAALPRSKATVTVKASPASALVPRILSLDGPSGGAVPRVSAPGPKSDAWKGVSLDALGPWTLTVGGDGNSAGAFTAKVKWKAARGKNEDHRDPSDPGAIEGSYGAFLFAPAGGPSSIPLLTGAVDFDGKGGAKHALGSVSLSLDLASPFGFTPLVTPMAKGKGSYRTDGTQAAVTLELGDSGRFSGDFSVAAGGTVLYTDPAVTNSSATGLLLSRNAVPAAADLAGQWLYVHSATGDAGSSTVEIGTMSFGTAGTVSGIGASTGITLDDQGNPVTGAQSAVFRTGTFSVTKDGTVTFVTRVNLFGAEETWTSRVLFREDIMAGGGPPEAPTSQLSLFLRQGLGLTNAAATGRYLHFGVATGTGLGLRTGTLTFDGAGGFAGTESLVDLAGGAPQTGIATTGTYDIQTSGIATVSFDGGGSGTGIVGPAADYFFTVSLATGGLGIDFLLGLD